MVDNLMDNYLSALTKDIKEKGGHTDRLFDTVYIGGGTPAILESKISDLLKSIKENFNISNGAEITAEVNPDVSDEFLNSAYKGGINRISVGIQSGNDSELKTLGRTHTGEQAKEAVRRIKKAGFKNISADLMICLPESDKKSLRNNLLYFLELDIPHISAYMLKIEPKTKFGILPPSLPDEDLQAEQYLYMCQFLEENGYNHYEISNFAKPGFESRHNLKYWNCEEYLGLGASAHSFFEGKRFYYPRDIKKYINSPQTVFDGYGGDRFEKIMLGLRLKKGIDLSEFLPYNDMVNERISQLVKSGLAEKNGNEFSLTDKGMLLSNSVINAVLELIV